MKKSIFNAVILVFTLLIVLTSCGKKKKTISYFDSSTQKLSNTIERKESFATSNDLFAMYYLGELKDVYVDNLIIPIENTGGQQMKYSYSKISTTTISNGIRNCVTQSSTISSSQSITASAGLSIPIKAVSLNIGASFQYTKLSTNTIEKTNEETYEKIISKAESYAGEYNVDLDKYEKDLFYTFGLFADVKIYQIIEYDINKENASSYLVSILENSAIRITCSKDKNFSLNEDLKLSAIKKIDKESLQEIIQSTNQVNSILYKNNIISNAEKINSSHHCNRSFSLTKKIGDMSKIGFEKIKIKVSMYIAEVDDSYQYVKLYSTKGDLLNRTYEHGGSKKNGNYEYYEINEAFDIDNPVLTEELFISFYAQNALFKDWYIKDVNISVEALWR